MQNRITNTICSHVGKRISLAAAIFAIGAILCQAQKVTQLGNPIPTVSTSGASGPLVITRGGTYSGKWNSSDPNKPAITIATNQPVTIEDSQVTGRGDLIAIYGSGSGANVQIRNVTGVAFNPNVWGMQRGHFVFAVRTSSLVIENCTMVGTSFGLYMNGNGTTVSKLQFLNNEGINLDDRASNGQGGLLPSRPILGHFFIIDSVSAPYGAEVAWNQLTQTIGSTSTEDVFNIYQSSGTATHPIWLHDNYMEGYSAVGASPAFGGNGVITDGSSSGPPTAFTRIERNQMVHTAGGGVAIDDGHDNLVTNNRIVSCGKNANGTWFAEPWAVAIHMWDYYHLGSTHFYNNRMVNTGGGLVRPNQNNAPEISDVWDPSPSNTYPGNSTNPNYFTDPCMVNGTLTTSPEASERNRWKTKLATAGVAVGDQHPLY